MKELSSIYPQLAITEDRDGRKLISNTVHCTSYKYDEYFIVNFKKHILETPK